MDADRTIVIAHKGLDTSAAGTRSLI